MPEKAFKAKLYDVRLGDPDHPVDADGLKSAIEKAAMLGLRDRVVSINGKYRRLEAFEIAGDPWLLNFVTAEFAGPGRTGLASPAVAIGLQSDENFAHETAMLYDPNAGVIWIESGLGGMGAGAVKQYFETFSDGLAITLTPRLDDLASAKARAFQEVRKIEYRVMAGPPSAIDEELGMRPITAFASPYEADEVDIVVKVERRKGKSLSISTIRSRLERLISGKEGHNIRGCKVYGRENDDDRLEYIDLFDHLLGGETKLKVDDTTRKVLHQDKWNALAEFHRNHIAHD